MTELDKVKRAKMYIDQLVKGIDPISGTPVPEGDVVKNARLIRCFFFISGVLGQVIENGGTAPQKGPKKIPYAVSYERRGDFVFSDIPIPASEIAKRLNDLTDDKDMKRMTYVMLAEWLVETGMLTAALGPDGKEVKRPTPQGTELGITVEDRISVNGPYQVVVYNRNAQQFLLDNLDAVLASEAVREEARRRPWTQKDDWRLEELSRSGTAVREMAAALERPVAAVRTRLKKLGLA